MATKEEKDQETHATLLLKINDSLELEEKKDIKYLCKAYLSAAELEKVANDDFCELVAKLETRGHKVSCRCGGYSKLLYLFEAADLPNIVELIEEFIGKGDSKGNGKEETEQETHLQLILTIKNSLESDEFKKIKAQCKAARYLKVAELENINGFFKLVDKLESKGHEVTWKRGGYSKLLHVFEKAELSPIVDLIKECERKLNPPSEADTKSEDKKDISGTDGKLKESDGKRENKEDSSVNAFKPKALCFGGDNDGKQEGNVDIQNIAENNSTYMITVALIDTGFRTDHASFSGLVANHTVELSYSFDADLCHIDNIFDGYGHGTGVLDVLLKTCENVKLNLILLKSDSRKTDSEALTEAFSFLLKWKRDTGKPIHVVSTSLGSLTHSVELNSATAELCLSSVVITAASNEGLKDSNTISYPSLYGNTICMGAHGTVGFREADYSPQGKELTFLGPGNHDNVASSKTSTELRSVKGTSFAAPHMAAWVAYILAIIGSWPNSEHVMKQVTNTHLMKQLLIGFSSEQSNPTKTSGYGRLKFEEINTDNLKHALKQKRINFGISS